MSFTNDRQFLAKNDIKKVTGRREAAGSNNSIGPSRENTNETENPRGHVKHFENFRLYLYLLKD